VLGVFFGECLGSKRGGAGFLFWVGFTYWWLSQ
jgi:hypothetical protein